MIPIYLAGFPEQYGQDTSLNFASLSVILIAPLSPAYMWAPYYTENHKII